MTTLPEAYGSTLSGLQVPSGLNEFQDGNYNENSVDHHHNTENALAADEDHSNKAFMFSSSVPPPTTPVSRVISDHELYRPSSIATHALSTPDTLPPSEAFYPHPDEMHNSLMDDVKLDNGHMLGPAQGSERQHGTPDVSDQPGEVPESRISAYARLDFASFTFYVQTLQVVMGRHVESGQAGRQNVNSAAIGSPADRPSLTRTPSKTIDDTEISNKPTAVGVNGAIDVHLGTAKAISRRHAKIFYNFANQRFEFSVLGRNGAFVDDVFVEKGATVHLNHGSRVQIGQIGFTFLLPSSSNLDAGDTTESQTIKPADAISFRDAKSFPSLPIVRRTSQEDGIKAEGHDDMEGKAEAHYSNFFADMRSEAIGLNQSEMDRAAAAMGAIEGQSFEQEQHENELREAEFNVLHALAGNSLENISHMIGRGDSMSRSPDTAVSHDDSSQLQPSSRQKLLNRRTEKRHPTPPSPSSIPEEYRVKPPNSYSSLIEISLRTFASERGMSLSDIYQAIQELFPYYRYAPYGWQNSVRHNLSLNKLFVKIAKEGKGWLWGLDEELYREKEAKKNRPLVRERKEQERREKKERERAEKEERERNAKIEKEKLDMLRHERDQVDKQRKELELAERQRALLALAQSASGKGSGLIPSVSGQASSLTPNASQKAAALKAKTLGTGSSISKPQQAKPPINKETLKALQLLQQTISAQLQGGTTATKGSPSSVNMATPAASSSQSGPTPSTTPVPASSNTSARPGNSYGSQPNAKAAALAKALVMTLAQSMAKPGSSGGTNASSVGSGKSE